jgi:hypothetical protein
VYHKAKKGRKKNNEWEWEWERVRIGSRFRIKREDQ